MSGTDLFEPLRPGTAPRDPAAPPLLAPATGPRHPGSPLRIQVAVLTRRCLQTAAADRRWLVRGLLPPVLLLVLLNEVFAGLGDLPGVAAFGGYTAFLVPGILVTLASTAAVGTGAGLAADGAGGMADRLRTLPVAPFAVLAARSTAGAALLAAQLPVVVLGAVVALGFRPAGGPLGVLGALAVATVVGWALGWVALAVVTATTRALRAGAGVLLVLALFASSACVPLSSMPARVRVLAEVNPLTHAVDAVRGLALGRPDLPVVGLVLVCAVGVAAVAAAVATRALRRAAR